MARPGKKEMNFSQIFGLCPHSSPTTAPVCGDTGKSHTSFSHSMAHVLLHPHCLPPARTLPWVCSSFLYLRTDSLAPSLDQAVLQAQRLQERTEASNPPQRTSHHRPYNCLTYFSVEMFALSGTVSVNV